MGCSSKLLRWLHWSAHLRLPKRTRTLLNLEYTTFSFIFQKYFMASCIFSDSEKKKTFITTLKNIESGSIPFSSTWEIIEWMESKCFWRVKAAKRVVYVTKDGLQISWVSEIDDGIKLVLEQGHGCLEREVGRWMKNTWCRRWLWEGWIMRSKDFVGIKWWNENGWCGAWWRVWVLWRPCIAMQRWGRRHPLMAVTNLTNSSGSLAKYLPRPPP